MSEAYRVVDEAAPPGDPEARAIVQGLLDRRESLLWAGRPIRGLRFTMRDAFALPFSLLWTAFAVFWMAMVWRAGAPWPFVLWGLPFVTIGFYMLVGRFFLDRLRRERTVYGVTSERAVIVVTKRGTRSVTSLDLHSQSAIDLEERSDGRGTIAFGFTAEGSATRGTPSRPTRPSFEGVENARAVYDQIREAQYALRHDTSDGSSTKTNARVAVADESDVQAQPDPLPGARR